MISGTCSGDFEPVRAAFEANFAERGEVGAGVCITVDGTTVVDLWGGKVGVDEGAAPWEADTLVIVYSCTKGATAMCAHLLADQGKLDLDAPVADYWPEYAVNGKERTTVRMMLDHSAGVPTWRERIPSGKVFDFDYMAERCAAEAPFWEPGTRHGYHMVSFGWLVGELVRRVSGKSLGTFLREHVAGPAGADFHLGFDESLDSRVAAVIPFIPDPAQRSHFAQHVIANRDGIPAMALMNGMFSPNTREARAAEIGGGGGHSSARGLAALYRPLATGDFVSAEHLARMGRVASSSTSDATLLLGTRFAEGFMVSIDNRRSAFGDTDSAVLSDTAFGHVGAGGSIGFCDPANRLSVGYAMNRMGSGILLNDRGQALVDAVYRCLGYRSNTVGAWTR